MRMPRADRGDSNPGEHESEIASLETTNARLTDFIQGQYLRVVGELTRDLRIFAAINALACLLLLCCRSRDRGPSIT